MKKYFYSLVWFLVFLMMTPVFADEMEDDSGVDNQPIYSINQEMSLIPTVKYQYGKSKVTIKSVYPVLVSDEENENIDEFNQLVLDFIREEASYFKQQVADNAALQKNLPASMEKKNDLNIDFDTTVINTRSRPIISVRFSIQGYMAGMAHPSHRHRVLNFDLGMGQQIELMDLFKSDSHYLYFLADYSNKILSKQLRDKQMIEEGTAPLPAHYQNWNINARGILITFDEPQVAPSVYGTQTVLIPYSELKDFISPDSLLAICLQHKKRCLGNHVSTGGFSEDAVNS